MNDPESLIKAIDKHLADDERQLAQVEAQHDAVHAAFADLLSRLQLEMHALSGGALHLRG